MLAKITKNYNRPSLKRAGLRRRKGTWFLKQETFQQKALKTFLQLFLSSSQKSVKNNFRYICNTAWPSETNKNTINPVITGHLMHFSCHVLN